MEPDAKPTLTSRDLGLMTYVQAAKAAGVSPSTIKEWVVRYGLTQEPARDHGITGRTKWLLREREVLEAERLTRRSARGRPRREATTAASNPSPTPNREDPS